MLCMRDDRSAGLRLLLWALPGAHSSLPPSQPQVLFAVPEVEQRYAAAAPRLFESAPSDPSTDLPSQMAKVRLWSLSLRARMDLQV
jgi:hypothetical protein